MVSLARWMIGTGMVVVTTIAAVAAIAHAASSPVQSTALSAGSTVVVSCDSVGTWTYGFTKDPQGRVASVEVSGISAACSGGTLDLTLVGPASSSTGTQVLLGGCSTTCSAVVTFPVDPPFPAEATSARSVIAGP